MKIKLKDWAAREFSPAPHKNTLRNWVNAGLLHPAPVFIGSAYFVEDCVKFLGGKKKRPPCHSKGNSHDTSAQQGPKELAR